MKIVVIRVVFVLFLLVLAACRAELHKETRLSMSTVLTVIVSSGKAPAWDDLFAFVDTQAAGYDHRLESSPLWTLNRQGEAFFPEPLRSLVETALEVAEQSSGAFDPTILPLTNLWSFDSGGTLPDEERVRTARKRVDYRVMQLGTDGRATLPEGFGLDLGGIAKGAVADHLADYLEARGFENYLIDAGGDILVSGQKFGEQPWVIAIRHPRSEQLLAVVKLGALGQRTAIVTSGDYERYFDRDGRRYHHILDPRTGFPAAGAVSVTVISDSGARADALATAAFVLGDLALLEAQANTEALLIREGPGGLQAVRTSGFPLSLDQLNLTVP